MKKIMVVGAILAAAILSAAPVSLNWSADRGVSILGLSVTQDRANAIVGRPATPRSVAGVARRTERRAIRRNVY